MMRLSKFLSLLALASGLTVGVQLIGCGDRSDGQETIASARSHLSKNELAAAKIELRSALQANPASAEARYLMGQALMREGDYAGATVEFAKAKDAGFPADDVVPAHARATLASGRFKQVTDLYSDTVMQRREAIADLAATMSVAWAMQGDSAKAEALLASALQAFPHSPTALLAKARMIASAGKVEEAMQLVETVIKLTPTSAEPWQLKGDLLFHGQHQAEAAVAAYRKALELDHRSWRAQGAIITVLLQLRRIDEASKQFDLLKKEYPKLLQTAYFQAQFAMLKGDLKSARDLYSMLLSAVPDNPKLLTLAGANDLQLGSLVKAENHLARAVSLAPLLLAPRRLLAETYLRSGRWAKVLQTLKPVLGTDTADAESLHMAAMAYVQSGELAQAERMFSRAAKANPDDPKIKTALALQRLSSGDAEGAFSTLVATAAADKGVTADLALINVRMRRREYDAALVAIDALEKKQPKAPLVADLRGRVLAAKRDFAGARASYERAVAMSPTYFPAVGRLVLLDLGDGKLEDARKRVEAVLKVAPTHPDALMALAELRSRQGAPVEDLADILRRATQANPNEKAPALALIDLYLANRIASKAVSAAQESLAQLPDDPDLLEALGRAQVAVGETQQALTTFGKLASIRPDSPDPLVRMAGAYIVRGELVPASQAFKRALQVAPDHVLAQQGLIQLSMKAGQVDVAIGIARSMQKQRPNSPLGYALEGDIQRARKSWAASREAYKAGMAKVADQSYLATKLHGSLLAEGKPEEAGRFAEGWLSEHPTDVVFPFHLGMVALGKKDYLTAERHFQDAVRKQPNYAIALNNLAWVSAELKRPAEARALSERALKLLPEHPDLLDTQAHVLAMSGELTLAIEAQRRAVDFAPGRTDLKLSLARLQIQAGDKTGARLTLEPLVSLGGSAVGRSEAERMLGTL